MKPSSRPLASLLAALLSAAALPTAFAAPPAPFDARAAFDALEQEKQVYNVYKAYFPNLEIARKAAISLHGQLLESRYAEGYLIAELDAEDMARLRSFGFRFEVATDFIESRNRTLTKMQQLQAARLAAGLPPENAIAGFPCYETVEETFTVADGLIAAKPNLAMWVGAGSSWLKTQNAGGYDIRVLKLTNRDIAGDKPKLFVQSAIHAREYTTAPLTLEFARWLVNGYGTNADATWIMDHHEVHLMLHANPDGRKRAETGLSWRKNVNNNYCANTNTRGADLNRNFSFGWNSTAGQGSSGSACNLTYRGPSPGSEPEVQAVQAYVRSLWPDRRGPNQNDAAPADTSGVHLDIHSFSQLVLWPWGTTTTPAPNGAALQTMGRRLAFFNGYTPQQSIGLYPTDGTSDGPSYGELGVAAFTIELGTAFFESCANYEASTKPNNLPALIYAAKVVRTPYLTPAGPDVLNLALAGPASTSGVYAGAAVALTATVTDSRFNNSNGAEPTQAIASAQYSIDTPPWQAGAVLLPLAAADGGFNSVTEAVGGSVSTAGLAPGQHIVYVRGTDAAGSTGPVSAVFVNVLATPQIGEVEPNNNFGEAQVVAALPVLVNARVSPLRNDRLGDVDVYRITVPAGRTLTATLTPGATSNADLRIYDVGLAQVAVSTLGTGQVDVASVSNTSSSDRVFYVRVNYVFDGVGATPTPYTLGLSL